MKISPVFFLLVLSILSCTSARPANQQRGVTDEGTIRLLEEQERLGVLNRDTAALRRVWSEQLIVNSPTNRVSSGRAVVLNFMQQGLIQYSSFERTIEHLRIDDNLAFVMGAETVHPMGNAPQAGQTVQRRFTHVWKKDGGVWLLAARHANVVPGR